MYRRESRVRIARGEFANEPFDPCPGKFNRVEIRRVGREIQQGATRRLDNLGDSASVMTSCIVQNQNCAFLQSREKIMLQKSFQIDSLDRAFLLKGGNHAQKVKRPQNGEVLSSLKRNGFNQSLAPSRPAVGKVHRQVKSRFIQKNESLRGDLLYLSPEGFPLDGAALSGDSGLFLKVIFRR